MITFLCGCYLIFKDEWSETKRFRLTLIALPEIFLEVMFYTFLKN